MWLEQGEPVGIGRQGDQRGTGGPCLEPCKVACLSQCVKRGATGG